MTHQDSNKSHGLTEVNRNISGVKEYVRGYSLIDITNTGVLAAYKSDASAFMDNANQIVKDQQSWNKSRNQQRNWETLMQSIGMITQPTVIKQPNLLKNQHTLNYRFGDCYAGEHNIWEFIIGAEHAGIFNIDVLKNTCNQIPIVINLKETIQPANSMFDTIQDVNLYFETSGF